MKAKCSRCGEVKEQIFSHLRLDGRNAKLYKDEFGSLWNGTKCPDCFKKQNRRTTNLRNLRKRELKRESKRYE